MKLLFICAQWHALEKLRLHNDLTLGLVEYTTIHLGAQMRRFYLECLTVPTKELKKEAEARARKASKNGKGAVGSAAQRPAELNVLKVP